MENIEPTLNDTFFFYGSLRRGMYNYERNKERLEFIGNAKINKFALYPVNKSYPAILPSESDDDFVVGEMFKFKDKQALMNTHNMELNACYKCVRVPATTEDGKETTALVYVYARPLKSKKIEHGDWVKYFNEKIIKARK